MFRYTPSGTVTRRSVALAVAIAATASGLLVPLSVHAQQGTTESTTPLRQNYYVPASSLTSALNTLAQQAGLTLSFSAQLTEGINSQRLNGQYSAEEALRELLAGSGLGYHFIDANTVTLRAVSAEQAAPTALSPLKVEASRLVSGGAIEGFRARRTSSATNTDAALIETPATVNVISSEMLERLNVRRLDDLLHYVPGASAGASGGALTNTFTIRGFQSSTTRGGRLGARANSVYIDGNRPASQRYHYDRSLYDRVEVLKGTSSLLYGAASPGGIVSYRSKQPEFEASREVALSVGDFDTRRATVDATGPIGNSGVAYRLITTAQKANQTFTGENHANSYDDRLIFKPQIAWHSDSGTRAMLSYEYSEQENVADPGILRFSDGSFGFNGPSLVSDQSYSEQANHIVTGSIEQPLSAHWTTTLALSYGTSSTDALWDTVNTRTSPARGELLDRDIIKFESDFEHKEGRLEFEGIHSVGIVENTATIGFTTRREGYDTNRVQASQRNAIDPERPFFASMPDLGPYNRRINWTIEEQGTYFQNTARVGNKLSLFGGLRHTDVETEFNDGGGNDNALNYSLGAIFNQNAWFNPFLSYSTSLTPQVGTLISGEPVPFSEGSQIETGIKSEWLDDDLATTLSLFRIEQSNQVESDPNDRSLSIVTGDQTVRGIELEAVGQLTERLTATGGYSYLDAEYTTSVLYEGNTPANVPEHKVSGMLNYHVPSDLGLWDIGLGVVHTVGRAGDDENSFNLPDYTRVDANLGWQRDGLALQLAIENLADEEYVSGSSGVFVNQGLPRSVYLRANFSF